MIKIYYMQQANNIKGSLKTKRLASQALVYFVEPNYKRSKNWYYDNFKSTLFPDFTAA